MACMHVHNTKFCTLEVASTISLVLDSQSRLNFKTIPLDIPEASYTLRIKQGMCLHHVWNVVVMQIVYAFQWIEKKVM